MVDNKRKSSSFHPIDEQTMYDYQRKAEISYESGEISKDEMLRRQQKAYAEHEMFIGNW